MTTERRPATEALLAELATVGDEHADLCGRAYIAIKATDARMAALMKAAERVDVAWSDGGEQIEYHDGLAEALIALRALLADLPAAAAEYHCAGCDGHD